MNHPMIANTNASERLNRMIEEAEHHRQVKQIAARKPARNLLSALRKHFPLLDDQPLNESASFHV